MTVGHLPVHYLVRALADYVAFLRKSARDSTLSVNEQERLSKDIDELTDVAELLKSKRIKFLHESDLMSNKRRMSQLCSFLDTYVQHLGDLADKIRQNYSAKSEDYMNDDRWIDIMNDATLYDSIRQSVSEQIKNM